MTSKRGMTLVELLVVVAIMMLLVAVGLPMLRPMLEKQSQSQGAQVLRVMLLRARNLAVEKGIPFGLRLERYTDPAGNPTEAAVRLSIVREQPAANAASNGPQPVGWRVAIDEFGKPTFYEWIAGIWDDGSVPATEQATRQQDFINNVGHGDRIQFWGSGEVYDVFVDDTPANLAANNAIRFVNRAAGTFSDTDVKGHPGDAMAVPPIPPNPGVWDGTIVPLATPNPYYATNLLAYRAIRRGLVDENNVFPPDFAATGIPAPVVIVYSPPPWIPTTTPPTFLPEGVCVDLEFSGIGKSGTNFTDLVRGSLGDVIVWFSTDGSLDRVDYHYFDGFGNAVYVPNRCDGLLHFLVGSWEQVATNRGVLGEDASTNLEFPANIWVTVEPRSARVLVNEIKTQVLTAPATAADVESARKFANEIWNEVAAPR